MKHKKVVILNSRQGLRPIGNDPWIVNSHRALMHAASRDCRLLTSTGMKSWQMVLFLASINKANQTIYLPIEGGVNSDKFKNEIIRQFRLEAVLCEWVIMNNTADNNCDQIRDGGIIDDADIIYPVSIRPGGNLEKLIETARRRGKEINNDFIVEYRNTAHRCRINISKENINLKIDDLLDDYLIHWTKATNSRWPGESYFEYYNSVLNSRSVYPRSGLHTLKRILTEQKIRPSVRHYRKGWPAVAFSSLAPGDAVGLMKWRARYREMTIEPYGIAIHKDYADTIGLRKVFYGNPEMYEYLEDNDKPYFQSIGTKGHWTPEREYRYIGDIDLSLVPSDRMAVIVFTPEELDLIRQVFDGHIHSLCK